MARIFQPSSTLCQIALGQLEIALHEPGICPLYELTGINPTDSWLVSSSQAG